MSGLNNPTTDLLSTSVGDCMLGPTVFPIPKSRYGKDKDQLRQPIQTAISYGAIELDFR